MAIKLAPDSNQTPAAFMGETEDSEVSSVLWMRRHVAVKNIESQVIPILQERARLREQYKR